MRCPRCLKAERRAKFVISAAGITACTDCFLKLLDEEQDLDKLAHMAGAYMRALHALNEGMGEAQKALKIN